MLVGFVFWTQLKLLYLGLVLGQRQLPASKEEQKMVKYYRATKSLLQK